MNYTVLHDLMNLIPHCYDINDF